MRITVTLARQLGCGGSSLGQLVADNLHVRCLDREIVSRAARRLELEESELEQREERGVSFWERMLRGISVTPPEALYQPPVMTSVSDQEVFAAETEVMKTIAAQEDCVIVGRVASHVLPMHSGMVNIFLHAPLRFRIQRVQTYHPALTDIQAREMIAQSDETRSRFITQMISRAWDDPRNYHLCLDTSSLRLPDLAEFITDFVRRKTAEG